MGFTQRLFLEKMGSEICKMQELFLLGPESRAKILEFVKLQVNFVGSFARMTEALKDNQN
jgi:hypothetical protein